MRGPSDIFRMRLSTRKHLYPTASESPESPYSRACRRCGNLLAPGLPVCLPCADVQRHLSRKSRTQVQRWIRRQGEGGRPFFIASATLLLGVLLYLLLLA